MDSEILNIKYHVWSTIEDILENNKTKNVDTKQAINLIQKFVMDKYENVSEERRHEEYYQMTGKAAIITRAWLQNYAPELSDTNQTSQSIQSYLDKTYGT